MSLQTIYTPYLILKSTLLFENAELTYNFVMLKNAISAKLNKAKCNETRYVVPVVQSLSHA